MSFATVGFILPHRLSDTSIHLGSLLRAQLEYPTVDVSFAYLAVIDKIVYSDHIGAGVAILTIDSFTDKAVVAGVQVNDHATLIGRLGSSITHYYGRLIPSATTEDQVIFKTVGGSITKIAALSTDIDYTGRLFALTCSGSTIKTGRKDTSTRINPLNPGLLVNLSTTDTSIASGSFGFRPIRETYPHGYVDTASAYLRAPLSVLPPALFILETDIVGNGTSEDPYRPDLPQNLAEIQQLAGLPDFLYKEAKKHNMLKARGFSDEEIGLLLGYIPQHQVDLNAITWGAFEFSEKSPTNIIVVTGDNPYQPRAIDRQIEYTRSKNLRVFTPPNSYSDAVALYSQLKNEHPEWLAGKDNFVYQVLGHEEYEPLAAADFYAGELIDHKTHYDQLKQVPDWELENTLNMWSDRLEDAKPNLPPDEYEKHREKLDRTFRLGW